MRLVGRLFAAACAFCFLLKHMCVVWWLQYTVQSIAYGDQSINLRAMTSSPFIVVGRVCSSAIGPGLIQVTCSTTLGQIRRRRGHLTLRNCLVGSSKTS
ncbi:hypothetical protein BKA81DRAFT_351081 [Phyllosticta paracitricarpa]